MELQHPEKEFRFLDVLAGIFVAVLVLSPICSSKIFAIGPLTLPGGVILFPIAMIFNDIFSEVYGFARCRRIIWTGLFAQALAAGALFLVGVLPPADFWPHQEAYNAVLGFAPRIAIASVVSYFLAEFANSYLLSKMKYWAKGERGVKQGWRFVASTIVGEAIDTGVVMTIAFAGVMDTKNFVKTTLILYAVKVVYEIVALPLSVPFSNWVKRLEHIDKIDDPDKTNYNPFAVLSNK
jgi:hypothetical protein